MPILTDPNPTGTALWGRLCEDACCFSLLLRYWYPLEALTRRDQSLRADLSRARVYGAARMLIPVYILVFGFILGIQVVPGGSPGMAAIFTMPGMLPDFAICEGIRRSNYFAFTLDVWFFRQSVERARELL
jgi:hypothetical protein